MLKTTEPVLVMTKAELQDIIDDAAMKAASAAVAELMKGGRNLAMPSKFTPVTGSGLHLVEFVRAEKYCAETGETMQAIYGHIRDGDWAAGKHYKRTGQRTLWINIKEAQEWIRKHAHIETVVPLPRKGSKSGQDEVS